MAGGGEALYQSISVTVPPGRDDAVLGAETSTGLATWDAMGVVEVRRMREPDGREVVTWRSVVPMATVTVAAAGKRVSPLLFCCCWGRGGA